MNDTKVKSKLLTEITLPGTHDSGSYSVTDDIFDDPSKSIFRDAIKIADKLGIKVGDIFKLWAQS